MPRKLKAPQPTVVQKGKKITFTATNSTLEGAAISSEAAVHLDGFVSTVKAADGTFVLTFKSPAKAVKAFDALFNANSVSKDPKEAAVGKFSEALAPGTKAKWISSSISNFAKSL